METAAVTLAPLRMNTHVMEHLLVFARSEEME
jgi:hypothetical protein